MPPRPSAYYQHPDGEDVIGKLAYTTKATGVFGLGIGILDAQIYTKPKGYLGALGRIFFWTWPAVGMSAAFVTTTYIATNLRKKDDSVNYALGGAAAGSILGTWKKSAGIGLFAAVVFAIAGAIKKEGVMQNYTFFPTDIPYRHQSLGSPNFDFSLSRHIPGNWKSGDEEQ